jgi:1,4-alpha-glucan branching enzyme
MHFVLTLHSHLPWVLNHGRWPHGSDWLCEATLDTYLPLLEILRALEAEGVPSPMTLGITPVLANQLASPVFQKEMTSFFRQRMQACDEAPASLRKTGDEALLHLADYWRDRFHRLLELFEETGGDIIGSFRSLENAGRIEIISSAATHGFLPLLGREESIRLQLRVGAAEHRRLTGRQPQGCWVPECAYRPGGTWDPIPGVSNAAHRPGVETYLAEAGFRYFFIDTHMAEAGDSLGAYGDVPHGTERFDVEWEGKPELAPASVRRSPYQSFLVAQEAGGRGVAAFAREPRSSMQVWSRHHGYPGDEWYLDFHKIRWPGGLKYWRVTGPDVDLGEKGPYDPARAAGRVYDHATHFSWLLRQIQQEENLGPGGVTMAPFDTELFGHWWFEGVGFLAELYRALPSREGVVTVTASQHLDSFPPQNALRPLEGSWGANGDFSMWLNPGTQWTWERLWPLEDAFWDVAREALGNVDNEAILAQAAKQLLLAQSSDWQFMISTGAVPDYAERRFNLHCEDLESLISALRPGASGEMVLEGRKRAHALEERDALFPNILDSVSEVLARR